MVGLDDGHLYLRGALLGFPGGQGDGPVDPEPEALVAGEARDTGQRPGQQLGLQPDVDGLRIEIRDDLVVGGELPVRQLGVELPGANLDAQHIAGLCQDGLLSVGQHVREGSSCRCAEENGLGNRRW